ncbi:MAG: 5-formyltetrahydrofolate cyclo-ligase [Rhodobacteraceae bacterium]|nr:5-formyltetrahydrofolate cyclo-ligase [Paracoccaceae bacterium]
MTNLADQKAALRKTACAARKLAHGQGHGPAATARLLDEIGTVQGRIIAAYMPIRTEVDPRPAMAVLSARNRICVPVIDGADKPLLFREWRPGARMVKGPFGAQIPEAGEWLVPQILFVPLVGFDARANRLGYGGGFYDRTLARLRARAPVRTPVRAIGFAYTAQELPPLPQEPTDQPLDAIVTEAGIIRRPARFLP